MAKFYKKLGYQVFSSDLLYLSYCLQKAYIENNVEPSFEKLLPKILSNASKLFMNPLDLVVEYLNHIKPIEGFVYQNYTLEGMEHLPQPRMYFCNENGKLVLGIKAPDLFKRAIQNLLDFWK